MNVLPGVMPIKMKDGGFYDEHSQSQHAAINMTLPYVEAAVGAVPLPGENEPFVIVDYGCSEGKNSVHVVNAIIDIVRRRRQDQLFNVIFNDLPHNNFNRLFENIYRGGFKQSLLAADEAGKNVLAFASGQPFHLQVMPARTVHFGYSSSAAHWLTELPKPAIRNHIYFSGATESEKKKLSEIAAKDWHNFLNLRALEMKSGARLVITMVASLTGSKRDIKIDDKHKSIYARRTGPQETYGAQIMLDLINEIVQQLALEKKISPQEAEAVWFPVYPRNLDEVLSPIMESELKQKFIVEQAELVQIACPVFEKYLQTGDSENYAKSMTEIARAVMETLLLNQLEKSELAKQKIIDEIFDRMQSRIQSQPEYYTFFPIHSVLVLARK